MEVNEEPTTPMVVGVDMQVIDYYVVAEAETYDKHYFIIQVQVEDLKYTVDRSYVDFVELDRLLKKLHPESAVPHLPLRAAPLIEKFLSKEATRQHEQNSNSSSGGFGFNRNSFSLTRDSLLASPSFKSSGVTNGNVLKIPENATEIIRNRMSPLTLYLTGIACYHELLTSYPLKNFLDEEYTSMLDLNIPPTLTEFDLLLLNAPVQSSVVHRIESHNIEVPADHYLLWRFKTAKFDIGFSLDLNGKTRLPFTRYRSNEQSIVGGILVTENSMVTLKWNNTYAKLHSKNLSWSTRIVSKEDYVSAREQALECEEEKIRFAEQRFALQRASVRHATTLSGIVHGSIIQAEYHETRQYSTKSLEENTNGLSHQREVLLSDLEKAEETVEILENKVISLEQQKQTLEQSKKIVSESWKFTTQQLETVQKELDELKIYINDLETTLDLRNREIMLFSHQIQENDDKEKELNDLIMTVIHNIDVLIEHNLQSNSNNNATLKKRDEELNQTLNNYDNHHAISNTKNEEDQEEAEAMSARFEGLLLLTQDLLDDLGRIVAVDQDTIEHLKQIRNDLFKLIKHKTPFPSTVGSVDMVERDYDEAEVLMNNSAVVNGPTPPTLKYSHPTNIPGNIGYETTIIDQRSINRRVITPLQSDNATTSTYLSPKSSLVSTPAQHSTSFTSSSLATSGKKQSHQKLPIPPSSTAASKVFSNNNTLDDF